MSRRVRQHLPGTADPNQRRRLAIGKNERTLSGQNYMILVVEDDEGARDSLLLLLRTADLEAWGFPSCEELAAATAPGDADCLILDIHLPGVSGIEFLETLRRTGARLPALLLSGRASAADARRAEAADALAILEKPFRPAELLALVRGALRRRPAASGPDRH